MICLRKKQEVINRRDKAAHENRSADRTVYADARSSLLRRCRTGRPFRNASFDHGLRSLLPASQVAS
jgi:hypothetical protein